MTLHRLVLTLTREGIEIRALYRSKGDSSPGTKARKKEHEPHQNWLRASSGGLRGPARRGRRVWIHHERGLSFGLSLTGCKQASEGSVMDPSSWEGYRRIALTVDPIVPAEEREKFRGLSRAETYHRIRPHTEPGERGAYTVEMTYEEYREALQDVEDPDVNLIAAEVPQPLQPHFCYVPNLPNLAYVGLRKVVSAGYGMGDGVIVGVIDGGPSPAVRDRVFAGRIAAAEDFVGLDGPYTDTHPHGSAMAGLAVPPAAQLAVAKVYTPTNFGSSSLLAEAIYWMADTAHADVVNMSIAGYFDQIVLSDAVEYAATEGVLLLASAGNLGNMTIEYPGGYPDVLCISNYDYRTDAKAPSSSYGSHVFAAAGGMDHYKYAESGNPEHVQDLGTSAACAMATRVAAYPLPVGLSAEATKDQLASSARRTGADAIYEGNGVLHLVPDGKGSNG